MSKVKTKRGFQAKGKNIMFILPEVEEKTEGGIIKTDEMLAAEALEMDSKILTICSKGEDVDKYEVGDNILITNANVPIFTIDGVRYGGVRDYDVFCVVV